MGGGGGWRARFFLSFRTKLFSFVFSTFVSEHLGQGSPNVRYKQLREAGGEGDILGRSATVYVGHCVHNIGQWYTRHCLNKNFEDDLDYGCSSSTFYDNVSGSEKKQALHL
jgi:hypothetical protein